MEHTPDPLPSQVSASHQAWRVRALSSAHHFDVVVVECRIACQDRHPFELRLGDEETVERIPVMRRKSGDAKRVAMLDRQSFDRAQSQLLRYERFGFDGQ